jgi:hypothetical protein
MTFRKGPQLLLGHIQRLGPLDAAAAVAQEIPPAEELLAADLVQNDGGIGRVDYPHADLERQVRLDQAGHDIAVRPLRGENQMDPGRAAHLRDPPHQSLKLLLLFLAGQDEVAELIEDDHMVGDVGAAAGEAGGVEEEVRQVTPLISASPPLPRRHRVRH